MISLMINVRRALPTPLPPFIATFRRELATSLSHKILELYEVIMCWCNMSADVKHLSL